MNRSKWMLSLLIVPVLGVCIAGYYGYQAYTTYSLIDETLKKNEWDKLIKQEKKKYDSKRGLFYKQIIFSDEQKFTYEFEVREEDEGKRVISFAINEKNEYMDNKDIAKYLLD